MIMHSRDHAAMVIAKVAMAEVDKILANILAGIIWHSESWNVFSDHAMIIERC